MSSPARSATQSPLDDLAQRTFHWPSSLGLWMVALYMALFLIRPWEVLFPWMQAVRFERTYAVAMLVVVLLTGRGLRWTSQTVAITMFAAAVAVSSAQAWQPEYAWPQLYQYATVVATYFVILVACRRMSDVNWLIVTYVATSYVYLGKSLWEYFVHDRHEYAQAVSRLVGIERTYGEPNAVAMSAVLSLPLWYYLWRCRHDLTWELSHLWRRLFWLALATYPLVVVVAVGLTNSRAGMIGLAAFVGGVAWYSQSHLRPMRTIPIAIVALLALWFVAPDEQKDRLRTLWDPDAGPANAQASASGRWEGFMAASQMVQQRPLTGVGVGNFVPYRVAYIDGVALVAHNLPGQILGETGWLGGLCFAGVVAAIWRNAQRVRRSSQGWQQLDSYYQLAIALQMTVLLSLLFGMSLHNGLRYNWLWIAAFGCLAWEFFPHASDSTISGSEGDEPWATHL